MSFDILGGQLGTFLLILVRVASMLMVAPIFGVRGVPAHFKIGLAFFVSLIAWSSVPGMQAQTGLLASPLLLLAAVVKEAAVGLVIGYVCVLIFSAAQLAGQFIDMQIGFSIVNVIDPQTGFHIPILGSFKNLLTILLFLGMDGHFGLLTAVLQSFQFLRPGSFPLSEGLLELLFKAFAVMFLLAVKISMPVVGALFLTDVGFAIMARTVPQMNIFFVGLPVKILLGLLMMILVMPVLAYFLQDLFHLLFRQVDSLLQLLGGRL
ncbi:flagellar biosynthetic protein FliR [Effusibacillus pohliae]|uniref:flagellar biosynthetic protein FliR n=1 Tax=Effusibacillus pohliae TaxID=232270 RepID=UPI00036698F5|nr:flagellar biosynthetic protein FliR [Effusibacillus pohliae]